MPSSATWPARISPRPASASTTISPRAARSRSRLEQANYLVQCAALGAGARVLVFNGRDGEFAAALAPIERKRASLTIGARIRPQEFPPDVDYLFAPLKHARLDYMAQKAVEMGARRLRPVITRRTQVSRVNLERLAANAREAAEQCGIIWLPEIADRSRSNARWPIGPPRRLLVFCDEDAPLANPLEALAAAPLANGRRPADRSRGRIRRMRTRGDLAHAQRVASQSRPAHPAGGHRGCRRAGAGSSAIRRLAMRGRAAMLPPRSVLFWRAMGFIAEIWRHSTRRACAFGRLSGQRRGIRRRQLELGARADGARSGSLPRARRRLFRGQGSSACMKISGYVSAGVGFVEPGRVAAPTTGPFAAHGAGFTDNHVGVSVDTQLRYGTRARASLCPGRTSFGRRDRRSNQSNASLNAGSTERRQGPSYFSIQSCAGERPGATISSSGSR